MHSPDVPEIRINSLVFHKNGTVIDCDWTGQEFWLCLRPDVGYVKFMRLPSGSFLSQQVLLAHSPIPDPLVSVRGVLWSRRAAIEADQAIASYQVETDRIEGSSLESDSSGCRHEV